VGAVINLEHQSDVMVPVVSTAVTHSNLYAASVSIQISDRKVREKGGLADDDWDNRERYAVQCGVV
jgi:hypothetical protein